MASFFSQLPTIFVADAKPDQQITYTEVRNIFRRVILEDKLKKYATAFEEYYIPEGVRPDNVAYQFYGESELDWIILISNNIVDVYEEWPKSEVNLIEYINEKYDDPDSVHHYETYEQRDGDVIIVPGGIEVNEDYRGVDLDGDILSKEDSLYPVTNYEHEAYLNDKKRLISIPSSNLVDFYEEQFRDLVNYLPNDEVDDRNRKKTPVSLASAFIDRNTFRKSALSSSGNNIASSGGGSSLSSVSVSSVGVETVAVETDTVTTTTETVITTDSGEVVSSSSSSSTTTTTTTTTTSSGSSSGY